ncbi:MAG: hypothetical protein KDJ90_06830 [Nitratireductor sp.]|nr:hypothetical protein [Nitratireductor sp.]
MTASAPYHELRDRTLAAVDARFAEPVRLAFLKDGKADPDRAAKDFSAPLRTKEELLSNASGGRAQDWQVNYAGAKAFLAINRAAYDGPMPVKGDKVQASSRPGEPWFQVLHVDDRHHTRMKLYLGEA